jgi:predicted glycoside hydrolase/deacetylase ChbG (UPF0249 family)
LSRARLLIVNADDFGFTRDVNEGIVEAHRNGILTAATLMANGPAFGHAAGLSRANPTLDVGCHLVLVQGESVLEPGRPLPESLPRLVAEVLAGRLRIHEELAAQVRRLMEAGIVPTHLDTHKHTHMLPPVLDAVLQVARDFRIRWIRRTLDIPVVRSRFERRLRRSGLRASDHFSGFRLTGRLGAAELIGVIRGLPPGLTEFMCHPGYCTAELEAAPTRLKASRQRELEALTAPEIREAVRETGTRLVSYREV